MSNRTTVSIAKLFGVPGIPEKHKIEINKERTHFVPKVEDEYQFRKELLSDLLAWYMLSRDSREGMLLTGPTGSGKSSVIKQIAARMNLPVQHAVGHARMELDELIGTKTIMDGDIVWEDGPLTTALRYGHIFLLDEFDLIDPGVITGLNGVVEGSALVLGANGGEVVEPHQDFRFVITGNTNGAGDANGLYQGTLQQNAAMMDRVWVVEVGYPDPDQELKILTVKFPKMPTQIVTKMIEVANEVRGLFMGDPEGSSSQQGSGGQIEVTMSTRTLTRWVQLSSFFQSKALDNINPFEYALDRALANRASPETKVALREIVQRHLPLSI